MNLMKRNRLHILIPAVLIAIFFTACNDGNNYDGRDTNDEMDTMGTQTPPPANNTTTTPPNRTNDRGINSNVRDTPPSVNDSM